MADDLKSKLKTDILHEMLGGRFVGGTLSQLANYSDLFLKMSEAVFLLDRNSFRVLECNPSACVLLKREESEILGKVFLSFLPDESTLVSRALQSQEKWSMDLELKHPDGTPAFWEVSAARLKILDYIEVIQFMAKEVTEVKLAARELQEMNAVLTQLSTTDEMTGLKNYRYFKEVLASVHHQAENFHHAYGIIFIDVDHFKKYNDRNGHPAGDGVLRKVAEILKQTARSVDLPARYGGEEFVILCRQSSMEEVLVQAERVRKGIEAAQFPFGEYQPLGKVSVSIGVSHYPEWGQGFEAILKTADQALYVSKEKGRNRVTSIADCLTATKKVAV